MAFTTINDPTKYFNTALWTGDHESGGAIKKAHPVVGLGFQPDLFWAKVRNHTNNHILLDTTRGFRQKRIISNSTDAEDSHDYFMTSTDSDGFTTDDDVNTNEADKTYVAWCWKANGGTETHSQSETGTSLACSTQANSTALFSITTYTGSGTAGDKITNGFGVVPAFHITKKRNGAEDWLVYHHKNTAAPETDHLLLNTTDATSDSDTRFNDTAPTSTLITYGNNGVCNGDASTYVNYAFAEVQGYSKFGSYTGNGNADGTFVYTGFKPALLIYKRSSAAGNDWVMVDNKRDPGNPTDRELYANGTYAEGDVDLLDFLSNGFKLRRTHASQNDDGSTYVYAAFAESPFVTSNGSPTNSR